MRKTAKIKLLILLVNTVLLTALYFLLAYAEFRYTHYLYIAVAAGLGLFFLIYNRGFVAKRITPDMLPDTMSPVEKARFFEEATERLERSRWVLTVLVPLLFALLCDIFYLFVFPVFSEAFL